MGFKIGPWTSAEVMRQAGAWGPLLQGVHLDERLLDERLLG